LRSGVHAPLSELGRTSGLWWSCRIHRSPRMRRSLVPSVPVYVNAPSCSRYRCLPRPLRRKSNWRLTPNLASSSTSHEARQLELDHSSSNHLVVASDVKAASPSNNMGQRHQKRKGASRYRVTSLDAEQSALGCSDVSRLHSLRRSATNMPSGPHTRHQPAISPMRLS